MNSPIFFKNFGHFIALEKEFLYLCISVKVLAGFYAE